MGTQQSASNSKSNLRQNVLQKKSIISRTVRPNSLKFWHKTDQYVVNTFVAWFWMGRLQSGDRLVQSWIPKFLFEICLSPSKFCLHKKCNISLNNRSNWLKFGSQVDWYVVNTHVSWFVVIRMGCRDTIVYRWRITNSDSKNLYLNMTINHIQYTIDITKIWAAIPPFRLRGVVE